MYKLNSITGITIKIRIKLIEIFGLQRNRSNSNLSSRQVTVDVITPITLITS